MSVEVPVIIALCGAAMAGIGLLSERATVRQLTMVMSGSALFATGLVWKYYLQFPPVTGLLPIH